MKTFKQFNEYHRELYQEEIDKIIDKLKNDETLTVEDKNNIRFNLKIFKPYL